MPVEVLIPGLQSGLRADLRAAALLYPLPGARVPCMQECRRPSCAARRSSSAHVKAAHSRPPLLSRSWAQQWRACHRVSRKVYSKERGLGGSPYGWIELACQFSFGLYRKKYCTLRQGSDIFRVPIHDFMSAAHIRSDLSAIFIELATVRSHSI